MEIQSVDKIRVPVLSSKIAIRERRPVMHAVEPETNNSLAQGRTVSIRCNQSQHEFRAGPIQADQADKKQTTGREFKKKPLWMMGFYQRETFPPQKAEMSTGGSNYPKQLRKTCDLFPASVGSTGRGRNANNLNVFVRLPVPRPSRSK